MSQKSSLGVGACLGITALVCCGPVAAAPAAGQPAPSPLSGPAVARPSGDAAAPTTLVAVNYDGKLRDLDAPPAIAALRLLDLDEAADKRARDVLHERAALMDTLVLSNLLLLSQIEGVMQAGTPAEKFAVIAQGLEALKPARDWGRIEVRVAAVLPPAAAERYQAIIDEYEAAAFEQARRLGEAEKRWQFRMQRHWADITWELERAAERSIPDEGDGLAALTEKLELRPDQEGEIRAMTEAWYFEVKGRPTEAQEKELFAKIMDHLDGAQKLKLLGMALRGELDKDKMNPP